MNIRGYKSTKDQSPRERKNGLITIAINFSTKVCNTYQFSRSFHAKNHNPARTITPMNPKTSRISSPLPITGGERRRNSSSSSSIVHTCRIIVKLGSQSCFGDVLGGLITGNTCHFGPLIISYMALLLGTAAWAGGGAVVTPRAESPLATKNRYFDSLALTCVR